ncbi:hypothetical protein FGG08_001870 [Glutinoglossum americanum]|uniref:Uncharacterized protein n=1 Tax=Glutinoglossum americanum TaxID=1670608 RepID=A0A9P8L5Z4_9PEZI|nr:hypothetical protein FGG08_001870 [Glutinoglossum americanum]
MYTTNPNQTFPQAQWLKAWPFRLANKVSAACQTRDIAIEFFTDKLSLSYTLASVWQPSASGDQILSSLSYFHNTLEDCYINEIQIELLAEDRTAVQFGRSQWGPKISASATCSITNAVGLTKFNLSTEYDLLPATGNGQQKSFLKLDSKEKASLWWGASLLGQDLIPRPDHDIASLDFFLAKYYFITQTDPTGKVPIYNNDDADNTGLSEWNKTKKYPNVWDVTDIYGKSLYSAVLADLGQASPPNILLDSGSAVLQEYTKDFANLKWIVHAEPGPARESFSDLKARGQTGSLSIKPSTIYQEYLCQVPQRKSPGSLIIAVIVADLVFLQTLWRILNLTATWYVEKRYPMAKYCEGSIRLLGNEEKNNLLKDGDSLTRESMEEEKEEREDLRSGGLFRGVYQKLLPR